MKKKIVNLKILNSMFEGRVFIDKIFFYRIETSIKLMSTYLLCFSYITFIIPFSSLFFQCHLYIFIHECILCIANFGSKFSLCLVSHIFQILHLTLVFSKLFAFEDG